jgi:hypothetical protein
VKKRSFEEETLNVRLLLGFVQRFLVALDVDGKTGTL